MNSKKYEIDMCNGSIMDKLIIFAFPLMLSSILQLMFNAVDIIVVGRYSGRQALAAVGSTFLQTSLSEFRSAQMFLRPDIMRPSRIKKCRKPYILQLHLR